MIAFRCLEKQIMRKHRNAFFRMYRLHDARKRHIISQLQIFIIQYDQICSFINGQKHEINSRRNVISVTAKQARVVGDEITTCAADKPNLIRRHILQ
jgi:hypothetical protein